MNEITNTLPSILYIDVERVAQSKWLVKEFVVKVCKVGGRAEKDGWGGGVVPNIGFNCC